MSIICRQCGRTIETEGVAFCPYCGTKLEAAAPVTETPEAEKWLRKAAQMKSYPERREILLKGLKECPDSREIRWELLFTGEHEDKRRWTVDFSVIKCWVLEMYRKPGDFTEEKRNRMREKLFEDPELKECLEMFGDPAGKQREYLQRLCREYVELFLEGSNQVMGSFLGFHSDRNKDKKLAVPVAEMIKRVREDEKLSPDQREQLWKALYQGYAARNGGRTEYLDERLN